MNIREGKRGECTLTLRTLKPGCVTMDVAFCDDEVRDVERYPGHIAMMSYLVGLLMGMTKSGELSRVPQDFSVPGDHNFITCAVSQNPDGMNVTVVREDPRADLN